MGSSPFFFRSNKMLNSGLDKQELLRIVEAVANEKSIDKEIVIGSMETAIQKAALTKFGNDNNIEVLIDRESGDIKIQKVLEIVEKVEDTAKEISLIEAKKTSSDLIFPDFKQIQNSVNLRDNFFNYSENKIFNLDDIKEGMKQQIHFNSFGAHGLFGINGRLIKRSIIVDNNLLFEESLRYLEDDTFAWDLLSFVRDARYIRKQLYIYNIYPNTSSAVVAGLSSGFPISNFKLVNNHVYDSLKKKNFSEKEIKILSDQALVFYIICALVSYSRSMFLGKVNFEDGIKCRRKIIDSILSDIDVLKAVHNYSRSKEESVWIPRAIAWRSRWLLEFLCTRRAKKILQIRRKYK